MAPKGKKALHGQIDEVDRISDLPEFILHQILSFLGTKEACRTCTLSKKWASVWDTVPFLDFQEKYFMEEDLGKSPSKFLSQSSYHNFIDRTFQRYSQQHLRVKKLNLVLPTVDPQVACLVDSWLRIAVSNGLEELHLSFSSRNSPNYRLPEILFTAKSLKVLRCREVELPFYQVMKLTSLQTLELDTVNADETMLQHIISSCPLIDLDLSTCLGLAHIVVHSLSKIEHLKVFRDGNANFNIKQETGSLRSFLSVGEMEPWPFQINAGALRNLKELKIYCASITDEVFVNLLYELTLVDTLEVIECCTLQNMIVSSHRLKILHFRECYDLENVVIDAPNLAEFSYENAEVSYENGLEMSLSFANVHPFCDAYFCIHMESTQTSWFVKLKEFLIKSNICKVLDIFFLIDVSMSKSDVDKLKKIDLGPAYEIRELKLSPCSWMRVESSLSALLDGLFWICHPVALSITTDLDMDNKVIKSLLKVLRDKAKSWKHPLRGVQVERVECPGLNESRSRVRDLKFWVKLSW